MRAERAYGTLVLGVFIGETAALAWLAWVLIAGGGQVARALLAVLAVTMTALGVLAANELAWEASAARRTRRRHAELPGWRDRWIEWMNGAGPAPAPPLPPVAIEALLDVREAVTGDAWQRLGAECERLGVIDHLTRELRARGVARRLLALEKLAKARLPGTLPLLTHFLDAPEAPLRALSARAIARTVAAMPAGRDREAALATATSGFASSRLSRGVLEESLLLLEDAAPAAIGRLLGTAAGAPLVAAVHAAGHLRLVEHIDQVAALVVTRDVELRTASLAALARFGALPASLERPIEMSLAAEDADVRAHACAAAGCVAGGALEPALVARLGDGSWPVRLAAAEALLFAGDSGSARLREAAAGHADRFARDIAAQVLRLASPPTAVAS